MRGLLLGGRRVRAAAHVLDGLGIDAREQRDALWHGRRHEIDTVQRAAFALERRNAVEKGALLTERGTQFRYHYHAIQSWGVAAAGEVSNVYA